MNWDHIEEKWQRFKGREKERRDRLSEDTFDLIKSRHDHFVWKLQKQHGYANAQPKRKVKEWRRVI